MSANATGSGEPSGPDAITCAEAAALLGVPPAALAQWAQRLEFPHEVGGDGATACFRRSEIEALRDALVRTHSVEGAVRAARDRSCD